MENSKPVVLITGAGGNIGRSLSAALQRGGYKVVGLDRKTSPDLDFPILACDFASEDSLRLALREAKDQVGSKLASVIHLVAYFDFTNDDHPLYRTVNVEGSVALLRALQAFQVEQFIYASTMLVHAPCRPGERIDESQPIAPGWAYPRSKAAAEEAIARERGSIPLAVLRLAGLYDRRSMVPTLAQQFAGVYERRMDSYFYPGDTNTGQAMLHRDDMLDAFLRCISARKSLPEASAFLIGEADAVGYDALQDRLARLMHGVADWPTRSVPKPLAAAGVWVQGALEPVVPDVIDDGRAPFVRPFMVQMADHHYALDTRAAERAFDWTPKHRLREELPGMVQELQADPVGWYERHDLVKPEWLNAAKNVHPSPDSLRREHEERCRTQHGDNRWVHMLNVALGSWLFTQPLLINVQEPALRVGEMLLGALLMIFATAALSWRAQWARWVCAAIGIVVMALPFMFWTQNAAAYLSDTLVGALVVAFAVATKPEPGVSPMAASAGPLIPLGWTYNPSSWTQRMPIILMALFGLYVSRYLAGYQLGHIPHVWDPFFEGSRTDPQNGTEEVIMSSLSKAFPVSDAALGGYTYLLEILTGVVGSVARWRTMPWLVILFGLMIAPLGVTSIAFIIIQPILIGTWSIVALLGAAAILVQIPYSLDEMIATIQFLRRRQRAGRNWLVVLFRGDTDEGTPAARDHDEFNRPAGAVLRDMAGGGVNLPWNLALAAAIGFALLFSPVLLDAQGLLAHAHHVAGCLALTVVSIAAAEVARPTRYLNVPVGLALACVPLFTDASMLVDAVSIGAGMALVILSLRRGAVKEQYGGWGRFLV